MKRVLIIGASGFTSKYLYNFINSPDKEIFFCDLVNAFDKKLLRRWYKTDFSDFKEAYRIISEINPDQIYNLAGSFSNDFETDYRNNVLLTKNIFDSILKLNINTRVLIIGSAAEYGVINIKDNPIKEDYKLNPASIYGLTKVFQTNLMTYYFNSKKINVVMVRTFNLIGKEIHKKLFIGSLFKQISEYKEKKINKIIVGNLDNKRDYIK
ncbi:MAG: NAD-dependent epimerase/dehydratase family protein, partial [Actinobacteria bacterium]|nr:NAD-dependent epimerase/dehydratase family protein [Actinomycetota bacterium]